MIGKTLQNLLDEKSTNVNELSKNIGVSAQTLYSIIRRDNMKIDFEVLLKICSYLDVSVEVFYQDYLRSSYNKKEPFGLLDESEEQLVSIYRELNQEGQEKLLDIADDLFASGKYKKDNSDGVAQEAFRSA